MYYDIFLIKADCGKFFTTPVPPLIPNHLLNFFQLSVV